MVTVVCSPERTSFFFFNDTATTEIYTLSLHDALPIYHWKIDWQMWFAAMSPADLHPWFLTFVQRLLENEKRIVSLLAHNPFPDAPPKFIRADWYRYRFTSPGERGWWTRTF